MASNNNSYYDPFITRLIHTLSETDMCLVHALPLGERREKSANVSLELRMVLNQLWSSKIKLLDEPTTIDNYAE